MNKKGNKRGKYFTGTLQVQILTKPEIPGTFIQQKCAEKNCNRLVGYWSLTGKPKPEYKDAKCEAHSKGETK